MSDWQAFFIIVLVHAGLANKFLKKCLRYVNSLVAIICVCKFKHILVQIVYSYDFNAMMHLYQVWYASCVHFVAHVLNMKQQGARCY